MTEPVLLVLNPPFGLAIFAALLAAATTEGSSMAIGIK
jgi:urea transporter